MKLTVYEQEHKEALAHAFQSRERFTLTGAGISAVFQAEVLNRDPRLFSPGRVEVNVELTQIGTPTMAGKWTGEGLPPVGCEFERRFVDQDSSSWAYGKVIAHGKRRVFYVDRTGDEWSHSPEDMEFRPIRTPEQIAEEEREKAIKEMIGFIGGSRRREAEYLYDAGYRKQDNADERK